jgi:hypothetical protein
MDKVIFDTNAYRYLVKNKEFNQIEKLIYKFKSREAKNNIDSLISPIVAKELLAHVANRKDPSFDKCLRAIKALYLHSGDDFTYNMIASSDLLISKAFFGKTIAEKEETNIAIMQMTYHLAKNPTKKIFKKLNRNLQANKEHVFDSENSFAIQMKQFVNHIDPNAEGWQIFPNDPKKRKEVLSYIRSDGVSFEIALGYLFIVYQLLFFSGEIELLTNDELYAKARDFVKVFPEPISLYKQVMENLVNSEFNIFENSRSNFVWDIHLMFNVGNHSIAGSKLYFVTNDKAIIKSAIQENAKYTILTYDEYIEYLRK